MVIRITDRYLTPPQGGPGTAENKSMKKYSSAILAMAVLTLVGAAHAAAPHVVAKPQTSLVIDAVAQARYQPALPPISKPFVVQKFDGKQPKALSCLAMHPHGTQVLVGGSDGALLINVKTGATQVIGKGHTVVAVAFTPAGEPVVAYRIGHEVLETTYPSFVNPNEKRITKRRKESLEIHIVREKRPCVIQLGGWIQESLYGMALNSVSVSQDGTQLAVGTSEGTKLFAVQPDGCRILSMVEGDAKATSLRNVYRLHYVANGKAEAHVMKKGRGLLDLATGAFVLADDQHAVTPGGRLTDLGTGFWRHRGLAVSPDGKLCCGYKISELQVCSLFKPQRGKTVYHAIHHGWSTYVEAAAFTPDSQQIVTIVGYNADTHAGKNRVGVYLWDAYSDKLVRVLLGQEKNLQPY